MSASEPLTLGDEVGIEASQDVVPPLWSDTCPHKGVRVEIQVDGNWIEIPTMETSTRLTKGDSASIQRGAKVRFLSPWGEDDATVVTNSPRELISQYNGSGEQPRLLFARISHDYADPDTEDHQWVYTHFGWVGSVGMTGDPGIGKFWVYDLAELFQAVPVTKTFSDPSVGQVANFIANEAKDEGRLPIVDAKIVPPNTEREFFDFIAESADFADPTIFFALGMAGPSQYESLGGLTEAAIGGPVDVGERIESSTIQTNTSLGPVTLGFGSKTFTSNHHTIADVVEWFEKRGNIKLHFEPSPNGEGVIMMVDVVPDRRRFTQREVASQIVKFVAGLEETAENLFSIAGLDADVDVSTYEATDIVNVQKNEALVESRPINTVTIRGSVTPKETAPPGVSPPYAYIGGTTAPGTAQGAARQYPVVKARVPALVDAAGGAEIGPVIESDATSLEAAKQEAFSELRERVEGSTEGEIVLDGHPYVMPYDLVDAFETCGEFVEIEPRAVTYEIEDVEHLKNADGLFETNLRVSIDVSTNIEIVSSTMQFVSE